MLVRVTVKAAMDAPDVQLAVKHHVLDVEAVADVRVRVQQAVNLHVQEGAARAVLVDALLDVLAADLVAALVQVAQEIAVVTVKELVVPLVHLVAAVVVAADLDVVENVLQAVQEVVVVHAHLAVVMLVLVADPDVQMLVLVDAGALAVVAALQLVEDVPAVLEIVIAPVELIARINAQALVVQDVADAKDVQAHAELVVAVTVAEHVKPAVVQDAEQRVAELVKQIVAEHVQAAVPPVLVDVLHVLDVADVQDVRVIVLDVLDVQVVVKAAVVIAVILLALKPVILAVTLVLPQFTKRTK